MSVYSELTLDYSNSSDTVITIDPKKTYQSMMGFGGAFTEAAAVTLNKMSPELQSEVIRKYYSQEEGIGYNIGRVHIHSCDFALGNYTYVDDHDTSLKSFNIDHDHELILPLIKEAIKEHGQPISILASPWSPPHWMKSNNEMNNGGSLLPAYYGPWAAYYVAFIKAYEAAGVPIWGITVQNEPAAVQVWDSCIYSSQEERDFVKDYLGPTMHAAGLAEKKILICDHNRDIMVERAQTVLSDPEAAKYVWGTGFHWYVSEAFENVGQVHELFPDKHLLFTEGCQEGGVHLGDWSTGERYGRNMIGDFNNWCEGYLDWNIVLDETGGPNHVNNLCDAPIICDTLHNELHYNSSYYYIGHFSKYVKSEAKRIYSECGLTDMHTVAFINPDGTIIVIVMNEGEEARELSLQLDGGTINMGLEGHSISTWIIEE